jgi:hypothetical protein
MRGWFTGTLFALLLPGTVEGQTAARPGRFEIAAGGLWAAPVSMGAADATETAPNGTRFRLFSSESSLASAIGLEGRIGVRLTTALQLEGSASHATPTQRIRIRSDAEGIPDITLAETVNQWTIEAALIAHLARWRVGTRSVPFLSVGVGYLRQLHERETLVEEGRIYHGGGGINVLLKQRPDDRRLKSAGVRLGARGEVRAGPGRLDNRVRIAPRVDASFFLTF